MWAATEDGESTKLGMAVLNEPKNRSARDRFFVVCDGLKGPTR